MKKLNLYTFLQVALLSLIPISSYGATIHFDSGTIVLNEFLANGAVGDSNRDGAFNSTDDEFIELVNTTSGSIDISGYTIWESNLGTARHTFSVGTVINSYEPILVFGGGTPTGFSGTQVQVAENADVGIQWGLDLNDITDRIIMRDASNNIIFDIEYNSSLDDMASQSLTRSPDVTGIFSGHNSALGAIGDYSPGVMVNGAAFTPTVPVPAAVWLFGSGLLGLIGFVRRKK